MRTKTNRRSLAKAAHPSSCAISKAVENKDWRAVEQLCTAQRRVTPGDKVAQRYLGLALASMGRLEEGLCEYEHAVQQQPDDAVTLISFASVLTLQRDFQRAYDFSKRATEVAPSLARAWVSLSETCYMVGEHIAAVAAVQQAVKLALTRDERLLLLNNLSSNLRDMGRMDEALATCREAMALEPEWDVPYTNRLLFLQSMARTHAADLRDAATEFADRFEKPLVSQWPTFASRDTDPHRKLRVAFLSPDFNQHPVMYFVEGLLPQLDRCQFEVISIYLQWGEDRVTQRVRRHSDEFHVMAGLLPSELAPRLLALNIDILIDLAGHTGLNGLRAMARKPAPVQVTWLGFPGTTGLTAIDWRITDGVADQPSADSEYIEKLLRLPDIFCVYRPHSRQPLNRYQAAYQVREAPALTQGFITFGSCNGLPKLTDNVLRTWGKVIRAVPDSRLLIESKGLESSTARAEFGARCIALGLPAERLDLIDRDANQQYLTYHRIDIALDSFPLNGGTTSTDLLWMGVSLVYLEGDSFRSRLGATLLHSLNRPEWIAQDESDYIRIACDLASDVQQLNSIRQQQRDRMEACPMMDEPRYTKNFESALRRMWQVWCAQKQCGKNKEATQELLQLWAKFELPPRAPQVTVAQGQTISLQAAQQQLQNLTEQALSVAPRAVVLAGCVEPPPITLPVWFEVLKWCEYILDAIPNEPLALATLAEIEHAHGRTDFASTYLQHAQKSLQRLNS